MSTSVIAMGIAGFVVINLVVGLAMLSLGVGAFESLFENAPCVIPNIREASF